MLPTLGPFSTQFKNKVKWIKSMFISFLGVAASFASVAYRIATSNFLSASLGAVRFVFVVLLEPFSLLWCMHVLLRHRLLWQIKLACQIQHREFCF